MYDIFRDTVYEKETSRGGTMESYKVSIIVPVYNVERYLRQCMDSLTGQTLDEIEIIAVNDGSPDNSLSILQ